MLTLLLRFFALLALAIPLGANATYTLPDGTCPECRTITWSAGSDIWNSGTLPNYTTSACGTLVGDGTTDDSAALQACINAASASTTVTVPAGVYYINARITMKSGVVLRGAKTSGQPFLPTADAQATTFKLGASGDIYFGTGSQGANISITSGYTKGSTSIVLPAGHGIVNGDWLVVSENPDTAIGVTATGSLGVCTWCGEADSSHLMTQIVQVTNVATNTLTLSRPLYYTFKSALNPVVRKTTFSVVGAGLEDVRLDGSFADHVAFITMNHTANSWVKGVETYEAGSGAKHAHIYVQWSYGAEIRDNYFHHGRASNSDRNYGIALFFPNSDHKIENNILRHHRHSISFEGGGSGIAVLYNYIDDNYTDDTSYLGSARSNHGAHPYMNLYEGNVISHIVSDSYWGSSSHNVFFRNHLWGDETGTGVPAKPNWGAIPFEAWNNQNYYSLVGNVLGIAGKWMSPNWFGYSVINSGCTGDAITRYGCSSNNTYNSVANSTSINHGNWDIKTAGVANWQGGADHVLQASMYYASKPSFLVSLPWPVIGPDVTNQVNTIPAQTRFAAAADAPVVTSALSAGATVGTPFSYTLTCSNVPTALTQSGKPAWASFNASTGVLSGTPDAAATTAVTIGCSNAYGSDSRTLSLTVVTAGTPTYVQTFTGGDDSTTTATTVTAATTTNTIAGNSLVALFSWQGTDASTPACTDTQGNTWTTLYNFEDTTTHQNTGVCYASNIVGGADTVTVTFGVTKTYRSILVDEFAGLASTTPVDVSRFNRNVSGTTAANNLTSGQGTTTVNGDLIWASLTLTENLGTVTAGTGSTLRGTRGTPPTRLYSETKLLATAGNVTSFFTTDTAGRYAVTQVAFKPATVVAPAITSALTQSATVGTPVSYTITCSNTPTGFTATTLPAGITLTNNVLSGTPTTAGSVSTTLGCSNTAGSDSKTLVWSVAYASTSTAIASSANPSDYGDSVTLTATITGANPGGTVTFKEGTATLGTGSTISSGVSTLDIATLSVGGHNVVAQYSGDAGNQGSSSAALQQTVNRKTTSVSLSSGTNPSTIGGSVTFTASVTGATPTGTVTFKDGVTTIGTGTISAGDATFSTSLLSVGSHSITAEYGGNPTNAVSVSSAVDQVVAAAGATVTLASGKTPSVFGEAVTFTATVAGSGPTGQVLFYDNGVYLGTSSLVAGRATLTRGDLDVGTHSLTASYGGDANNAGGTSAGATQVVNKVTATAVVTSSLNPTNDTEFTTFEVAVFGNSPTGNVTFKDGAVTLGTAALANGRASLRTNALAVGNHTVTVDYAGDLVNSTATSPAITQVVQTVGAVLTAPGAVTIH